MQKLEISDFPPAKTINTNESEDYPIIRCEECYEIPTIILKIDNKEIQLKCQKEEKTKEIPFENFFSTLKKYEDINCCQFCKNKNPSQKYYLCKTCNNKILCDNCFNEHNKNDDIIKFKIDSTCKKHHNPFESYCPKCKEHQCSYCSVDHEESHEKDEFFLKKNFFKRNKLDEFKNTTKKIKSLKDKVEQTINSVLKELEEKIIFLKNLKSKFFESLNMKMKLVQLILNNYEKKLANFDMNYFIINNLENQINFNLLELNLNKNDSLDKKIDDVTQYLNTHLNCQFNFKDEDKNNKIEKQENILGNDIKDVVYKKIKEYEFNAIGLLDINKNLFALYSLDSINFISKTNYEIKFQLKEYELDGIKLCKPINEDKILILNRNNIIIVDIIDNNDYIIRQKFDFYSDVYDFNSNLDIISLDYKSQGFSYSFYITFFKFPDYNKCKYKMKIKEERYRKDVDKIQFIKDNLFFHISSDILELYSIEGSKFILEKNVKMEIDFKNATIFDLNDEFYCLNEKT